jgi:hypothetical protein
MCQYEINEITYALIRAATPVVEPCTLLLLSYFEYPTMCQKETFNSIGWTPLHLDMSQVLGEVENLWFKWISKSFFTSTHTFLAKEHKHEPRFVAYLYNRAIRNHSYPPNQTCGDHQKQWMSLAIKWIAS